MSSSSASTLRLRDCDLPLRFGLNLRVDARSGKYHGHLHLLEHLYSSSSSLQSTSVSPSSTCGSVDEAIAIQKFRGWKARIHYRQDTAKHYSRPTGPPTSRRRDRPIPYSCGRVPSAIMRSVRSIYPPDEECTRASGKGTPGGVVEHTASSSGFAFSNVTTTIRTFA